MLMFLNMEHSIGPFKSSVVRDLLIPPKSESNATRDSISSLKRSLRFDSTHSHALKITMAGNESPFQPTGVNSHNVPDEIEREDSVTAKRLRNQQSETQKRCNTAVVTRGGSSKNFVWSTIATIVKAE